jgi:hypothetical protein
VPLAPQTTAKPENHLGFSVMDARQLPKALKRRG